MKKIFLSVLLSICLGSSFSQVQRMLVPAGEYLLNATSVIPSYCIDHTLAAPSSYDQFVKSTTNMFISKTKGGTTVTKALSEVNGNWVKVTGTDEGINTLKIVPLHPGDGAVYKLSVKNTPGILSDKYNNVTTRLPPNARLTTFREKLKAIDDPAVRTAATQSVIWKIQDGESVENINDFFEKLSLLKDDIEKATQFSDPKVSASLKEDFVYRISDGMPLEKVKSSIDRTIKWELVRQKVNKLFSNNQQLLKDLQWKGLEMQVLADLIDGNLLKLNNGVLDEASQALLQHFGETSDKIYKYGLSCCESLLENIKQIQKKNGLAETGLPTPELDNILNEYGKPYEIVIDYYKGKTEKVLAYANPYYSPQFILDVDGKYYFYKVGSSPELLSVKKIDELEGAFRDEVLYQSNDRTIFLNISSMDKKTNQVKVQLGNTYRNVAWSDHNSFAQIISELDEKIKLIPDNTRIVLARDMFTKGKFGSYDKQIDADLFGSKLLTKTYIEDRAWINYTELIRELQNKYPTKKFSLGGDFYLDKKLSTYKVKTGSDITAFVAPKSISLDQISVAKNKLAASGIRVHELDKGFSTPEDIAQSNVLLLSGHKNEEFESYLKELADKRLLQDKVVAVFSCNERGTANLNSYLIQKGYAKKVLFFPSKIDADAVSAVFSEFSELTKNIPANQGFDFDELIMKAIKNAANNPKYQDLKKEIELMEQIIQQTSFIENKLNKNGNIG